MDNTRWNEKDRSMEGGKEVSRSGEGDREREKDK